MELPFTQDEFFAVFAAYNRSVWPAQIGLVVLGLVILAAAYRGRDRFASLVAAGLSGLWMWMAIVYHWTFFRVINPVATVFGALFLLQSVLFIVDFVFQRERAPASLSARTSGIAMVGYALLIYPALGWLLGQRYPEFPTFGLPCPTTIATFGVLAFRRTRSPWWLLIIPTAWGLVGTAAAFSLGVYEDLVLLAAVLSFWALRWHERARPIWRQVVVS